MHLVENVNVLTATCTPFSSNFLKKFFLELLTAAADMQKYFPLPPSPRRKETTTSYIFSPLPSSERMSFREKD
jgi:hypothetical protein